MTGRDQFPDSAAIEAADSSADPATFPDWLSFRAGVNAHRIALEADGERWTWMQLDTDATALARQLLALGARPGDRIATLLQNGSAPVVLVHAVLRVGAILVPLNLRLSDVELAWQLRDSGAWLLLAEASTRELADAAWRASRSAPSGGNGELRAIALVESGKPGRMSLTEAPPAASAKAAERSAGSVGLHGDPVALRLVHRASDVLAVIYTSGTTGTPKGAQLTVGNFWWSAIGSALNLGVHADDRWLAVLPLFHIGGLSIVLRSAIHGMTVVVHRAFDAGAVNRAVDEERISLVSVVSVMLQRMLDARGGRLSPSSLRGVLLGGGPAPAALLERCAAAGLPVAQTYGLTEACSQVATLSPDDALRKPGSAGRPLYPNAVRMARNDGSEAPRGEPGEIFVRGPIVMAGYWRQPDASARAIVNGWLHTGDVGRLDDEGYLYVLDRRDDLIISGGENIYPAEVEAALLRHAWVEEAGVIGVADDEWGQRVVAIVRLADGSLAAPPDAATALQMHCRSLLAGYKVPREIRLTSDPLPRTASGKLKRAELRSFS